MILDTAGRLHIDEELMQQLQRIDRRVTPDQVYLVVDAHDRPGRGEQRQGV